MQDLLSDDERAVVDRVRAFLRTAVVPIANDCWTRAEFPHQVMIVGRAVTGLSAFV